MRGMGLLAGWAVACLPAFAQFQSVPPPQPLDEIATLATASARNASEYRIEAARHLYMRYWPQILDGKLPPMLHAVAAFRTTVDSRGRITDLRITRYPASAHEVVPWIQRLVYAAEPYPPPPRGMKSVVYPEVWLVTATPQEIAEVIAERLGLTGGLGTLIERKDGILTGKLVGKPLHGKAKRKAVLALAKERGINLAKSYAYSDSVNDLPMLTAVGHAVAVNPDKALATYAKATEWPILDFKKRELRANK